MARRYHHSRPRPAALARGTLERIAMPSTVAVIRCESYDPAEVDAAVARGVALLGGIERFAKPGERILIKPNLLVAATSDELVTTNPAVFAAVAKLLATTGAELVWGDSPAFGSGSAAGRKAGIAAAAEALGVTNVDMNAGRTVSFPEGDLIKQWTIAEEALDADAIVNVCKMKAHGLARITCAVKNLFGCVPGVLKGEFHARLSDVDRFDRMLVDLNRLLRPRLHVCDGVVAMEGNGPRSGDPKQMNVILLSEDPVALDATFCRMAALDVQLVGTCVHGQAQGLGTYEKIEYVGDPVDSFVAPDFVVNRDPASTTGKDSGLARVARNLITPRPVIRAARCTRCGTCVKMCPVDPKAVDWPVSGEPGSGIPVHVYSRCIRCYCCQELCPERAIEVETPPLGRLIKR
jgi:uncharacterized protein (DUF362 family)/Pyruvate/2-oxoacid:ferredoxin oxidoreductase delta subunit